MKRLNKAQVQELKGIISNHMSVLLHMTTGDGQPSPDLLKQLKLPKVLNDLITSSYLYGKLNVLQGKNLSTMSSSEVSKLIKGLETTPSQQYSIEQSKLKSEQFIDGLTQRITSTVVSSALQSDLSMWQVVKTAVPNSLRQDTPRYKVVQQLREATGDWERDWNRVAQTEMWGAKCQGEVESILNGESPLSKDKEGTLVYVRPSHNACNKCKQLYLEHDGVTPKVFKLSELTAFGSNYGKKQADWVPCVPPLHPNCMCTINVMPTDTAFDEGGNLIFKPQTKH